LTKLHGKEKILPTLVSFTQRLAKHASAVYPLLAALAAPNIMSHIVFNDPQFPWERKLENGSSSRSTENRPGSLVGSLVGC